MCVCGCVWQHEHINFDVFNKMRCNRSRGGMTPYWIKPCYSPLITIHIPTPTNIGYRVSGIEFVIIYKAPGEKKDKKKNVSE